MFTHALFEFLTDLAENNDRDWFHAHKGRYEAHVVAPSLAFIEAFRARLHAISPHFLAVAKKQGGSMFRIFRDTRFSKDKTPYKRNVGMQFRHELASRDVHAPGFYLHIEPDSVGVGVGMWHPESGALARIRKRVATDGDAWEGVKSQILGGGLAFMGESLKRPPRGFDGEHPLIEDLKRKDWAVHRPLSDAEVLGDGALDLVADAFQAGAPLVRFLCETQDLPF